MQDRADQKGMAGLLPMIAPLELAFGIDEDVGDVLHVPHLALPTADLEQRIVSGAGGIGRIEQQDTPEPRPPSGCQLPVFALDVVDNRGAGPCQQAWDHQTDALAGAGGGEAQHVFRAVMPEVALFETAQHDPVVCEQPGGGDILGACPSGRAIGCHVARLARPQDRQQDGDGKGGDPACAGDCGPFHEDARRVGVVPVPPGEDLPRAIDRQAEEGGERRAKLGLEPETKRDPLRRCPDKEQRHDADDEDLAPEDLGGR